MGAFNYPAGEHVRVTEHVRRKALALEVLDVAACTNGATGLVRSGNDITRAYRVRLGYSFATCECIAYGKCSHMHALALAVNKREPCAGPVGRCGVCQRVLDPKSSVEDIFKKLERP